MFKIIFKTMASMALCILYSVHSTMERFGEFLFFKWRFQ